MVEHRPWRRFLCLALWVSSAAFVVGFVADGFWGGTEGQTSWVDQSFGFAMYLGGALSIALAILLLARLLISGASQLIRNARTASRHNEVVVEAEDARDARRRLLRTRRQCEDSKRRVR